MNATFWEVLPRLCAFSGTLCLYGASQMFWFRRIGSILERWLPRRSHRRWVGGGLFLLYALLFAVNFSFRRNFNETPYLSLHHLFITLPFALWNFGSIGGFFLVGLLRFPMLLLRAGRWTWRRVRRQPAREWFSPERRAFLDRSVYVAGTVPFFAGVYGFLHERLDVEVSPVKIVLPRLPREFHGFRVAQLSDVHIGGFMTEAQIRKTAAQVNRLQPDLVALTGDYVTWDPGTQDHVVAALSSLRAPYGVFGCLGNHEIWAGVQDSITELFRKAGVRILRRQNQLLEEGGGRLNLIGVDYQRERVGYLQGLEGLLPLNTATILLSHNPNSFPRAGELGIDLSLSGHTHGGQVSLEFIHPALTCSRFITSYVQGHFRERESQLYVNRGLGTIGFPVRLNAPPEITLFELVRS